MVMILMVTPKLIRVASWFIVGVTGLAALLSCKLDHHEVSRDRHLYMWLVQSY